MMNTVATTRPYRIILATTGLSDIVDFLCHNPLVHLIGIIDCLRLENSCIEYAKQENIHHCFFKDFEQLEKWIMSLNTDLMIVYKMPFLLPENIFKIPHLGTINIHPSLLPKYRGTNPWFWIYYNMEVLSGVTIHKMDKYEDHGDILAQASFSIVLGSYLPTVQKESEQLAISLLIYVLTNWNNIEAIPQKKYSNTIHAINQIDFNKLFDLATMRGIHLWHILRGFPWIFKKIYPGVDKYNYSIGSFTDGYQQHDIGRIAYIENKTYLICHDGIIEIIMQ